MLYIMKEKSFFYVKTLWITFLKNEDGLFVDSAKWMRYNRDTVQ